MSAPLPRRKRKASFPEEAARQSETAEPGAVRLLRGHSGATLSLQEQGRSRILRKTAAEQARNDRLRSQSALQRRLSSYGIPFPRVLSEGEDEAGLAFFEMEFVPAHSLADLVCKLDPPDRRTVLATLERTFRFFRLTMRDMLPAAAFQAKIDQIAQHCRTSQPAMRHGAAIAQMSARLGALRWDGVPSSLCHGDMTLENMLFSRARGLVFIDCDDCFVASYWLDAAKLFQDIAGHWCLRELHMSAASSAGVESAALALERFAPPLRAMLALVDSQLAIRLPQFAALNLFRTLPYAKNERLTAFVLERMTHVLDSAQL